MKLKLTTFIISIICFQGINAQATYKKTLAKIEQDRLSMLKDSISLDSCNRYLTHTFFNSIYPQWIGTTWDYNGYTNTPKKGMIACGYFVSTPLKHMGFNWNRYKLAQMYSKQIIESTCDTVIVLKTKGKLINYMQNQNNGIYIIGLSNHVGFIIKINNQSWFVHSNYFDNKGPCKEKISSSLAIDASTAYWIGKFTTKTNAKKWLNKTPYKF